VVWDQEAQGSPACPGLGLEVPDFQDCLVWVREVLGFQDYLGLDRAALVSQVSS
jgi:hypothetical protein